MTEVSVPDLGDFADVPVIEIHVTTGDVVSAEDPLVTLESDKATMDVPSPAAGTVRELRVKVGDLVSRGSPILLLDQEGTNTVPPSLTEQQEPPGQETADPVAAAQSRPGVRLRRVRLRRVRLRFRRLRAARRWRLRRLRLARPVLERRTLTACTPGRGRGGSRGSLAWTWPGWPGAGRRGGSPRTT